MTRRYDPQSTSDLGRLDAQAIESVREQAWPQVRNADEMHEALTGLGCVTAQEALAEGGWPELLAKLAKDQRATRIDVGASLWFAAEALPQAQALYPGARHAPAIEAPAEFAQRRWTREEALVELLRARLSGLGPAPAGALAESLALPQLDIDMALLKLEGEGYAMRGRFTPGATVEQWCERHLLARIHRYTIGRLRREIEPVERHDFMRFLCDWQRVSPATRASGPDALASVLAQLEGFEAPAGGWETELLPVRITDYSIAWLDDLCTAGRIAWARLRGPARDGGTGSGGPVRATPIVLLPRRQLAAWTGLASGQPVDDPPLSSRAQRVVDHLQAHGASFFDELVSGAHLLRTELEDALAELVARGRVNCDSFAGLRALLVPQGRRAARHGRNRRRASLMGIEDAGRWTLARRTCAGKTDACVQGGDPSMPPRDPDWVEHVARTLLRRYGVVCWRMLEREAPWLPPWRELLRVYHRLEARGEIRGGRFIAGLSGEQFALAEAIASLRAIRKRAPDGALIAVSASDPLNLVGTVLPGEKVPRIAGARVLYRDGIAIARLVSGEVDMLARLSPEETRLARKRLLREPDSVLATGVPASPDVVSSAAS